MHATAECPLPLRKLRARFQGDCKAGAYVIMSLTALHLRCPCVYYSQPLARKTPVWLRVASGLVRANRQIRLHSARTNDQLRDLTLLH